MPHELRMGRTENNIDGVWAGFEDSRHGIDHSLDAFARRQEAERQNDRLSSETEFRFSVVRFHERIIRYSVWYDLNLARGRVVNRTEEFVAFLRHDNGL